MDARTCGILIPVDGALVWKYEDGFQDCLLRMGHGEKHLCKLVNGRYILWESALDCEDQGCDLFPECDCFDYEELTVREAMDLLGIHSPC